MYSASIPVFQQLLGSLDDILAKAEAHIAAHHIEPAALSQARLFPDMFPLTLQVQIACDFAGGIAARLAAVEVPKFDGTSQSFAELRAQIGRAVSFIGSFTPAQFESSDQREIVLRAGTPAERRFNGETYLLHYGMPQFVFHVTTAYAILRHSGVDIGKRDFLGKF
jgi:hypothetical protein